MSWCLGVPVGTICSQSGTFLERYCIPAPAVGGLLFSVVNLIGVQTGAFEFVFDQTLKDFFMIAFFSTIGFSASLKVIKKGGIAIAILFVVSSIMLIIQNLWGSPLLGSSAWIRCWACAPVPSL